MEQQREIEKKNHTGKFVLLGLGIVALGVGGYFVYQHFTKDKDLTTDFDAVDSTENDSFELPGQVNESRGSSSTSNGFPLKRGSRGKLVKALQKAIAKRYGIAVLGRGGIDGIFGRDTEKALTLNNLPKEIGRRVFEKIVGINNRKAKKDGSNQNPETGITINNPKELANSLSVHIFKGRFDLAIEILEKIKTVQDYELINEFFKEIKIGVRKTIVTALLRRFNSSDDQTKLSKHFKRIGLVKMADGKWYKPSLGNIPLFDSQLKAIRRAKIWNTKGQTLTVPANTILGEFRSAKKGITEFTTLDNKVLQIKTQNVAYV